MRHRPYLIYLMFMCIAANESTTAFSTISYKNYDAPNKVGVFDKEVTCWLDSEDVPFEELDTQKFTEISRFRLLGVGRPNPSQEVEGSSRSYKTVLHILPTPTSDPSTHIKPTLCKELTDSKVFDTIIHLHEDVWNNKKDIVKSRILAMVGRTRRRWYARNLSVRRIDRCTAINFLEINHLWGATQSKFNYGLFSMEEELIAVATFSPRRHVHRFAGNNLQQKYRSHELIRYSSVRDGRCIGGITKLIAEFIRQHAPDDIITCIDRDWGDGSGWKNIGFVKVGVMPPLIMAIGEDGVRRYCVGIGPTDEDETRRRTSRPGINANVWKALDSVSTINEAFRCLHMHQLYPIFDAGVERRMLLVADSKWGIQASQKRSELGLGDLPTGLDALRLWNNSSPSFPSSYYVNNKGLNLLLKGAYTK